MGLEVYRRNPDGTRGERVGMPPQSADPLPLDVPPRQDVPVDLVRLAHRHAETGNTFARGVLRRLRRKGRL